MGIRKAQSAMEYLMTYGWAILIVIIVAAALYALGVFNPGTFTSNTATGFNQFQVATGGWQVNTTHLTLKMKNAAGAPVKIQNISTTIGTNLGYNLTSLGGTATDLATSEEGTYYIPLQPSQTPVTSVGSAYTVTVEITYANADTGLTGFKETGTLTGTVL